MFSSDGDDGGELGDVAAYFRLIASVLLCGASFPTAADNGFIAALQQDPDRAWYALPVAPYCRNSAFDLSASHSLLSHAPVMFSV